LFVTNDISDDINNVINYKTSA